MSAWEGDLAGSVVHHVSWDCAGVGLGIMQEWRLEAHRIVVGEDHSGCRMWRSAGCSCCIGSEVGSGRVVKAVLRGVSRRLRSVDAVTIVVDTVLVV